MFWKKTKPREPESETQVPPDQAPPRDTSPSEKMISAAKAIAEGLRSYEAAALANEEQVPDPELVEAQGKLEAARKIVMDGRLGYALVRQFVEHTKYWSSWINRDDFSSYVDFGASEITVEHEEAKDDCGRRIEGATSPVFAATSPLRRKSPTGLSLVSGRTLDSESWASACSRSKMRM